MPVRGVVLSLGLLGAVSFAFGGVASAQEEPSLEAVAAMFAGTTIDDWTDDGFILTPDCVTAEGSGAPAELGAMGFHAVHPGRIDFEIVADEPEALLIDGDGNVVGFEYEVPDQSQDRPALFGQEFDDTPPHPGAEVAHWSLHVWTIDNPAGQFLPFNAALSCPVEAAADSVQELAQTGSDVHVLALVGLTLMVGGLLLTETHRRLRSCN